VIITKKYECLPAFVSFHASKARCRGLVGPFRSGKSVAAVWELLLMAKHMLNVCLEGKIRPEAIQSGVVCRTLCVRRTYPMLRDSVIKTFFQWVPQEAGEWKQSELIFKFPLGGGYFWEVLFRSADSADEIDRFKGVEITNFWIDEAVEVDQDVKLILEGRCSYPAGMPTECKRSILTTNPCPTDHYIYRIFVKDPLDSHEHWRQSAKENKFIGDEYYDELRAQFRDRPEMMRRYVDGEWGSVFSGKPVYGNEFNWDFHVSKQHLKPIGGVEIYCGWDFGLSPACVFTQISPTGQWLILRELYSDDMGIDEFSDAVIDFCNREFTGFVFKDVGDPAGKARSTTDEKSCYDILRSKRRVCREAPTNALLPRLEAVKRKLTRSPRGNPQVLIDPRCSRLIDGFGGGYRYVERPASDSYKSYADTPEKNQYSHIHDALQYVGLVLFGYSDHLDHMFKAPMIQNIGVVNA